MYVCWLCIFSIFVIGTAPAQTYPYCHTRSLHDSLPVCDVVAHALDEVHRVTGHDDGAPAGGISAQDVLDVGGRHRVDRLEWLIQHEQPGRVDECAREEIGRAHV